MTHFQQASYLLLYAGRTRVAWQHSCISNGDVLKHYRGITFIPIHYLKSVLDPKRRYLPVFSFAF